MNAQRKVSLYPYRAIRPAFSRDIQVRILSLDGGGMRAIIPAMILAKLEQMLQEATQNPDARMIDYFDFISGTSAGGILACFYSTPDEKRPDRPKYSAQEVLDFYHQGGLQTFQVSAESRSEKYCSSHFESQLQTGLGKEAYIQQLLRPTMLTSYDMRQQRPLFLKSWESPKVRAWEAARASSAAPGLFKPAQIEAFQEAELIDGSMVAANPAMCALSTISTMRFSTFDKGICNLNYPTLGDSLLVSLGTGRKVDPPKQKRNSILRTLMHTMNTTSVELVDQQIKQLFAAHRQGSYYRFNPLLSAAIDEVQEKAIENVFAAGAHFIENCQDRIEKLAESLLA